MFLEDPGVHHAGSIVIDDGAHVATLDGEP
jgi:hypothetical protein